MRRRMRLALETLARVGVVGEVRGQNLDRHSAIESRVARFVDLAHPARADLRRQLYGPMRCPSRVFITIASSTQTSNGVSKELSARASHAKSDSTSWRSASSSLHLSARYAGRFSTGSARAPSNTSSTRGQSFGGRGMRSGFYSWPQPRFTDQASGRFPPESSRANQALANRESRITVSGATFRTTAVSSTVKPPKKRSSII